MKNAIRKHWGDVALWIGVVVAALLVGGYILSNQRFYLPHWVPVVGSDFVDYKAAFTTAQSVTPGQGQTIQIAGVDVGDITSVDLKNGQAVVTMKIRRKYTPIYRNATALLRPKTGLNDMVIELDPGSKTAGPAPHGWTVPINQTLPNVNFDEILSSLDADTRDYLQLLLGAAGEGLDGQGKKLSASLKRFEPTGRYLARVNGALAERERNIRRSIHNFRLLSQALGAKDDDLAALVDSSNRVFQAFANQDARLRETLQELPGALQATNTALGKVDKLGKVLGPTLGALRPGARALGPSLVQTRPFLEQTTPIIQNQLRPFTREALPVVKTLRPAARDLAVVTPHLTSSFKVLNRLLNELAYNPPGKEEGYLFWASWANHDGATVFSTQDAQGPIRHGLVLASCSTLAVLQQLRTVVPQLGTLGQLLNEPPTSSICPQSSQPGAAGTQQPSTVPPATPSVPAVRSAAPLAPTLGAERREP
jgi:phospholipid/cholesterol/gamma-HCH transport system substrate-binding protein